MRPIPAEPWLQFRTISLKRRPRFSSLPKVQVSADRLRRAGNDVVKDQAVSRDEGPVHLEVSGDSLGAVIAVDEQGNQFGDPREVPESSAWSRPRWESLRTSSRRCPLLAKDRLRGVIAPARNPAELAVGRVERDRTSASSAATRVRRKGSAHARADLGSSRGRRRSNSASRSRNSSRNWNGETTTRRKVESIDMVDRVRRPCERHPVEGDDRALHRESGSYMAHDFSQRREALPRVRVRIARLTSSPITPARFARRNSCRFTNALT